MQNRWLQFFGHLGTCISHPGNTLAVYESLERDSHRALAGVWNQSSSEYLRRQVWSGATQSSPQCLCWIASNMEEAISCGLERPTVAEAADVVIVVFFSPCEMPDSHDTSASMLSLSKMQQITWSRSCLYHSHAHPSHSGSLGPGWAFKSTLFDCTPWRISLLGILL